MFPRAKEISRQIDSADNEEESVRRLLCSVKSLLCMYNIIQNDSYSNVRAWRNTYK